MKYWVETKEKKQKRNIKSILKQTLIEQTNIICSFMKPANIAIMVQFLVPCFLVALGCSYITALVVSAITTYLTAYLKVLNDVMKESTNHIPTPPRKFIEVDRDGFIGLKNKNDMPELLQYLYELETYLESKGRINNGTD